MFNVGSYKRSDGVKVDSYCRNKGGNGSSAKKSKTKKSTTKKASTKKSGTKKLIKKQAAAKKKTDAKKKAKAKKKAAARKNQVLPNENPNFLTWSQST